ncbi:phenylacetate-coenzyme A ligase PaaK-like adenylate-forming protein [Catalinimonas alkaloidigena]|uniref:hypothetical protein n=1 Tax=Catalinimonas alkaloidigena TaxID=1075417 RepID=UPI0024065EC1|nr:hypothetical protein [Catalinimonas alkaloidigena]MDF9796747.1 phenylacetate-coenzyme A ligase PaaK-like adenylate-forming protein [Catalinimonas alkaloidigena]
MQELSNVRFLRLLNKAYSQSAFYKKYYDDYGIDIQKIKSLDDLNILPVIRKEHIRKYCNEFLTSGKSFLTKGYTSGTSGTPLTVFRNYGAVIEENAYLWA